MASETLNTDHQTNSQDLRLTIANTNSAKGPSEKDNLNEEGHVTVTFTKVPGTQKINTDDENGHNGDVDGQVIELISESKSSSMRNHLLMTHITIPECDQNRSSGYFTGDANSGSLRSAVRNLRKLSGETRRRT